MIIDYLHIDEQIIIILLKSSINECLYFADIYMHKLPHIFYVVRVKWEISLLMVTALLDPELSCEE